MKPKARRRNLDNLQLRWFCIRQPLHQIGGEGNIEIGVQANDDPRLRAIVVSVYCRRNTRLPSAPTLCRSLKFISPPHEPPPNLYTISISCFPTRLWCERY